jgi:hypothetical protein
MVVVAGKNKSPDAVIAWQTWITAEYWPQAVYGP